MANKSTNIFIRPSLKAINHLHHDGLPPLLTTMFQDGAETDTYATIHP